MRTRMFGRALCAALAISAIGVAPASGATNVLADWTMAAGAGQVIADAGGHGHDGLLGGSPSADSADPAWVAGPNRGNALRFSGGQYVAVPDTPDLEPATVAVDAWVRADQSPGQWRYALSKGSLDCDRAAYGLYSGFTGGLAFYVSSQTLYTISPEAPTGTIWNGAWHHVVGSFDGHRVRLFIDGAQVGDGTPATDPIAYGSGSKGVYIGTYRGSCEKPFIGDIGPVRVLDGLPADLTGPASSGGTITPAPGTPTSLRVIGASSVYPGTGTSNHPPGSSVSRCLIVTVQVRKIHLLRPTRLHVTVRRGRAAVARAGVIARGAGVRVSGRTDRKGRTDLMVKARAKGKVSVSVIGQPKACGAATVRVAA